MHPEILALDALLILGRVGRWLLANPDEAAGALFGLVGAFLLAGNGRHARWGWIAFMASNAALLAFAWRYTHPGVFALQLGFTYTSARGIWIWIIKPSLYWHEWRGDLDGLNVVMHIMHLARWGDWRLDLHKMVGCDSPGCYHSHPAKALRWVLWNGYEEEVLDREHKDERTGVHTCASHRRRWWPLMVGLVRPELTHRIATLPRGTSYSLWLRWPKTHKIELRGPGWSAPAQFTGAPLTEANAVRSLTDTTGPQMMRDYLDEIEQGHASNQRQRCQRFVDCGKPAGHGGPCNSGMA